MRTEHEEANEQQQQMKKNRITCFTKNTRPNKMNRKSKRRAAQKK